MDVPNIPPGPLSRETAERLSRLLVAVTQNQAGGYPATPPPSFHGGTWASESVNDDYVNRELWARLTGYDSDTGWYAWEEVLSATTDTDEPPVWELKPGGRTGTVEENPAWEKAGVAVDYSGQPVVRLRREHWREDVGWCWAFSAADATNFPVGSAVFYETDVYCIADVLQVFKRRVTLTVTNGALSQSTGDWYYDHDAGCCACDTVTTCCAPCADGTATNVYLHVAVQTGPAGSTGYPSCYDCYDLQLQYDAESGAWEISTGTGTRCSSAASFCGFIPRRLFREILSVFERNAGGEHDGKPVVDCYQVGDLATLTFGETRNVGGTFDMVSGWTREGLPCGDVGNVYLCDGDKALYEWFSCVAPNSGTVVSAYSHGILCDIEYPNTGVLSCGQVEIGDESNSSFSNPVSVYFDSGIFGNSPFYTNPPCEDAYNTGLTVRVFEATVGNDGETPCPCVDFSWRCNETTDTYELVVSYDDGGITVSTTYQPAASPVPCTTKEWVYESVALPDGSTATIYVNCSPTRDCAGAGSNPGGCNLTRVNQGSTTGADSVSLGGVVLEEGQLLVVVLGYRAPSAGTLSAHVEGTPDLTLDLLNAVYDNDNDLGVAVLVKEIPAAYAGTKTVVAGNTAADAVAVSVYCVEGLPATVTLDDSQVEVDPATGNPNIPNDLIALDSSCPFLGAAFASDGGSDDTHGSWSAGWTSGGQDVGGLSSDPHPVYLMESYRAPGAAGFYGVNVSGNTSRNWALVDFAVY